MTQALEMLKKFTESQTFNDKLKEIFASIVEYIMFANNLDFFSDQEFNSNSIL